MWLFKLLSLSKVNWLPGKTWKKNVAGDTSGLASLIEHLHMNRGETARHVRGGRKALWETSARHLRFRCFSHIFNTFHRRSAGLFQAGISDSRKWASAFEAEFLVPQSVPRFDRLGPPQARKSIFLFALDDKNKSSLRMCVDITLTPSPCDS